MEIKEKSILSLDKKLRKIEKNQNKILFGYKMYKYLRVAVIIVLIWAIVGTVFSFESVSGDDGDGERRRLPSEGGEKERGSLVVTQTVAKEPVRLLHSLSANNAGPSLQGVPQHRQDCACL